MSTKHPQTAIATASVILSEDYTRQDLRDDLSSVGSKLYTWENFEYVERNGITAAIFDVIYGTAKGANRDDINRTLRGALRTDKFEVAKRASIERL